ncbi:MAG: hypothetical protein EOL87_08545 [Spartobacteria bacterium]|nr:hypothetical protein [Spartobacteria bacterium]
MKKLTAIALLSLMMSISVAPVAQAGSGRGGFMGFIAGCCFGMRAGGQYNEGKDIHWREWCMFIPVVGMAISIWNGVDGASGVTEADYADQYGSQYF